MDLFAPAADAAAPNDDGAAVKAEDEADANDKRSWMSSAQLWSCGSHDDSTANTNAVAAAHNKVRQRGPRDSSLIRHTCRFFLLKKTKFFLVQKLFACFAQFAAKFLGNSFILVFF